MRKNLKKLIACASATFSLMINVSYGHQEIHTKANCTWGWKYKAIARINKGPGIRHQSQYGCGGPYVAYPTPYDCVWARTTNNFGTPTFEGKVYNTNWCGRGIPSSDLHQKLTYSSDPLDSVLLESTRILNGPIAFVDGVIKKYVTIPILEGLMETTTGMMTEYEVIVWRPQHDYNNNIEDTVHTNDKTVGSVKLQLTDGQLITSGGGDIIGPKLTVTQDGDYTRLDLSNHAISITLPPNVSLDEVIVTIRSHAAAAEQSTFRRALTQTESFVTNNQVKFNVFPNPVENQFTLTYSPKIDGKTAATLYDSEGRLVKVLFEGNLKREEDFEFVGQLEELGLSPGLYFISLEHNKELFLKKLIITK